MAAKVVLRDTGIKRIGLNRVVAAQKSEIVFGDEQMQETAHPANAAVTVRRLNVGWCFNFKPHSPAMTAAFMSCHECVPVIRFSQTASKLFAGIA